MAYKEHKVKKIYWKVGEVAQYLSTPTKKISDSCVRYWVDTFSEFLIFTRKRKYHRSFTQNNIETLIVIRNLLHYEKYTIQGAIIQLKKMRDS